MDSDQKITHEIDTRYDRISNVLYPFSGLRDIDPEILANAASRGTVVHKICDSLILRHGKFDLEELVKGYSQNDIHYAKELEKVNLMIESFETWYKDKKFIPKPKRFYETHNMITGECDMIYSDKDRLVLVDIKTPLTESKSWMLQGTAYSYMAKKQGINIDRIEFIKLSKTGGKPKVFVYEENWFLFKSVLDIYRYFYKNEEKHENLDYL